MDSEEIDPIAKKLRDAATRKQEANDASAGEKLLAGDFAKLARGMGPAELTKIEDAARARVSKINAQGPLGQNTFRYENARRSIEAGLYATTFSTVTNGYFQLRLNVGFALDAAQRTDELPIIEPQTWHYQASADEDGFFWLDEATGERCPADQIVNNAFGTF
jgi:hypothetical protein